MSFNSNDLIFAFPAFTVFELSTGTMTGSQIFPGATMATATPQLVEIVSSLKMTRF